MAMMAERLDRGELPEVPGDITIIPVQSAQDKEDFIQFVYSHYQGDPNWVPPLLMERRDFLNPTKNPWFEFGRVELLLARRHGKAIGRIAAVNDPRYNEFHNAKVGFLGMFECINHPGVARGLFDAAAAWNRAQGFEQMIGPVNFSTNYECSVLIEGFDAPPAMMMAYNPRYYPSLYQACGFEKAKDLLAWDLSSSIAAPPRIVRVAEKIREREGIVVRPVKMREFASEVSRIREIYNSAWEKNWGFVPLTDKEFDHIAKEMKPLVVAELLLIAEVRGEPVAFAMTLPDANVALKAANGRLTTFGIPIGLIRLWLAARKIQRLRLITLGIKEGYRRQGIDAVLYLDTLLNARRLGYAGGEISWTLEDNHLVNRAIEMMGGKRYKTYRIYQRAL